MFDGSNDFVLWKKKMYAFLTQINIYGATDTDDISIVATEVDKNKLEKKAYIAIIFNLSDKVFG